MRLFKKVVFEMIFMGFMTVDFTKILVQYNSLHHLFFYSQNILLNIYSMMHNRVFKRNKLFSVITHSCSGTTSLKQHNRHLF